MAAVATQQLELIELLLSAGASVLVTDAFGCTVISAASCPLDHQVRVRGRGRGRGRGKVRVRVRVRGRFRGRGRVRVRVRVVLPRRGRGVRPLAIRQVGVEARIHVRLHLLWWCVVR